MNLLKWTGLLPCRLLHCCSVAKVWGTIDPGRSLWIVSATTLKFVTSWVWRHSHVTSPMTSLIDAPYRHFFVASLLDTIAPESLSFRDILHQSCEQTESEIHIRSTDRHIDMLLSTDNKGRLKLAAHKQITAVFYLTLMFYATFPENTSIANTQLQLQLQLMG